MATERKEVENQFDFWLGKWRVNWGDGQEGSNRIDRILDGKVIRERFDGNPSMPFQGMSLTVYDHQHGLWRQTWVDNQGNYWNFSGGWDGERMVLATEVTDEGKPIHLRMVFYNITENELDWSWERSEDGGRTWALAWHIHYNRT